MPWETPLNQILESVQGPVAKIISVIIITVTGLTLAFGDTSGGISPIDPDRLRPVYRLRRVKLLPVLLLLLRRSAGLMAAIGDPDVPGFFAPVHRSLSDPILMGGAPRTVAIANGTLAVGYRLGATAVDSRRAHLGGGTWRRRLGGQARSAFRRRGAPASALPVLSRRMRHRRVKLC